MKIIKTASGKYKLTKQAWEEIGKKAGWMKKSQVIPEEGFANGREPDTEEIKEYPKPTLKKEKKYLDGWLVTYPVSYIYNGGIIIEGKWYKGFKVPSPLIPKGYKIVNIGLGLNLNAKPPRATVYLKPF